MAPLCPYRGERETLGGEGFLKEYNQKKPCQIIATKPVPWIKSLTSYPRIPMIPSAGFTFLRMCMTAST
jgi:hypothetical protein